MSQDERFIQRCLQIAENGQSTVAPNPLVGCVIVYEGRIIAEGYHHHPGGPHAEVVAIQKVKDPHILKNCTLYVSLEPCAHFGRTPPCSDLILEKGIPRVVIATRDLNAAVNGKGIEKLRAAGIEVKEGLLAEEAQFQNRHFFTFHGKNRPYITLKWAQSADGFMDAARDASEKGINWISSPESQAYSHKLRVNHSAILVGRKTVEVDNPSLNARAYKGQDPLRVIIDANNKLDHQDFKVFRDQNYLRFCNSPTGKQDCPLDPNKNTLRQILHKLHSLEINSLLVEGGAKTLASFIEADLWDEAHIIQAKHNLGLGLKAPKINGKYEESSLGTDKLLKYFR